ncbi:hypothetical protein FZEAL_2513 [Fusarium zealandicum]|uniref:Uncharacterized protein n=1 Tax=Fusarium zealandicum TaxID=1053134 RepID=A0A8H4XNC5_9HYPO|nr:hypothetical protein FZEAL_2513 [Fusarium zealandicum]
MQFSITSTVVLLALGLSSAMANPVPEPNTLVQRDCDCSCKADCSTNCKNGFTANPVGMSACMLACGDSCGCDPDTMCCEDGSSCKGYNCCANPRAQSEA